MYVCVTGKNLQQAVSLYEEVGALSLTHTLFLHSESGSMVILSPTSFSHSPALSNIHIHTYSSQALQTDSDSTGDILSNLAYCYGNGIGVEQGLSLPSLSSSFSLSLSLPFLLLSRSFSLCQSDLPFSLHRPQAGHRSLSEGQ